MDRVNCDSFQAALVFCYVNAFFTLGKESRVSLDASPYTADHRLDRNMTFLLYRVLELYVSMRLMTR
jgi:hypothetical protein